MRKGELVRLDRETACWRTPTQDDMDEWHNKWARVPTDDGEIRLPPQLWIMDPPETPLVVVRARCASPNGIYRSRQGNWCQLLDPVRGYTIWANRAHCVPMQG